MDRVLFCMLSVLIPLSRAIPIDNGLVDSDLVKECVSNKSVDLVLVLDGSGSIGDETFQLQLNFATLLSRRLNVSATGSHFSIIQFAETPVLEFSLTQYQQQDQLEYAINRIRYLSGATNTGAALRFAQEKAFNDARGGDVPKVVVVVTDGQSQDEVSAPSQALRDSQALVFAIGVTNLVNVHELHLITGNPVRVFTVESFDQLDKSLADSLTWDMCKTEFRPGTPDIICAPDRIGVRASTKKPFDGYVFVMDHFHDEKCRMGTLKLGSDTFQLNPPGIYVEMTVVFMFHTLFMTKVDQMVKIQCFYMEADKTVSVPLEVSMITTQFREKVYEMPTCSYTLRRGSPEGEIVQFASLGESVYHRWECPDTKDTFGMLVHSCYVDNGYGDRVDILDNNGCGLDAVLLSTPEYSSDLRLATRAYHVFKYADRPVLQFQCQVTLCLKLDGGCANVTPPKCPETAAAHHHHVHSSRRRARDTTMDVFTEKITILDELPQSCPVNLDLFSQLSNPSLLGLCLANLLFFTFSLSICLSASHRRRRRSSIEDLKPPAIDECRTHF